MQVSSGEHSAFFVLLYMKDDLHSVMGAKHDLSESRYLIFDHELAHALIKQAQGEKQLSEGTADSYAAIRHIQRFGSETGTVEKLFKRRAATGILWDFDHFTSPALESLLEVLDDIDVTTLSPHETARLAEYVAQAGNLSAQQVRALTPYFNKLSKEMEHVTDDTALRQLAKAATSSRSPTVKKWSAVALNAFLDRTIALQSDAKSIPLEGNFWDKVRQKLTPGG